MVCCGLFFYRRKLKVSSFATNVKEKEYMSEQEKLLYNLVKEFVHAARYDCLDWKDWPKDSRKPLRI